MMIPDSVRLVYCYFGNGIALGAYGPREDIDIVLNGLYNYYGHKDDETQYLSDNFGYVLTSKEMLLRGLENAHCTRLLTDLVGGSKDSRKGVWDEARKRAAATFATIQHEAFLTGATPAEEYAVVPQTSL